MSFSVGQASTGTTQRIWKVKKKMKKNNNLGDGRVLVRIDVYGKRKVYFFAGKASTGTNRRVWKVKSVFFCRTSEYWYKPMSMESEKCLLL